MSRKAPESKPSSALTTALSLALFMHLFVVGVMLASNWSVSTLQSRLLGLLRPYAQALNFDLNYTPFYLTHGTLADVDHRLEYRAGLADEGTPWAVIGGGASPWGESAKRYDRWAKLMASYADQDLEQVPAEIARAAAEHVRSRTSTAPTQIRVRRHLLQTMDAAAGQDNNAQRNPHHESYFQTPYEANVLWDDQERATVAKVAGRSESAQPARGEAP